MDSAKHTLRNYQPEFEEGQLYYEKPEKVSPIETFLFWIIIGAILFLFWKNVLQFLGVI